MIYEWDLVELKFIPMEFTDVEMLNFANWVNVPGRPPKEGDIVKLVNGPTVKVFRMPSDWPMDRNDIGAAQIDWHEIIGGTLTVLNWLQKILLMVQGMVPKQQGQ